MPYVPAKFIEWLGDPGDWRACAICTAPGQHFYLSVVTPDGEELVTDAEYACPSCVFSKWAERYGGQWPHLFVFAHPPQGGGPEDPG